MVKKCAVQCTATNRQPLQPSQQQQQQQQSTNNNSNCLVIIYKRICVGGDGQIYDKRHATVTNLRLEEVTETRKPMLYSYRDLQKSLSTYLDMMIDF